MKGEGVWEGKRGIGKGGEDIVKGIGKGSEGRGREAREWEGIGKGNGFGKGNEGRARREAREGEGYREARIGRGG